MRNIILLNKYSNLSGIDKRITILSDERIEVLKSINALRNDASALMSASQQKEHDWATHGGIASGIAVPAAGVSAAMDVQAKNAKIRAQNEASINAFTLIMMASILKLLIMTVENKICLKKLRQQRLN